MLPDRIATGLFALRVVKIEGVLKFGDLPLKIDIHVIIGTIIFCHQTGFGHMVWWRPFVFVPPQTSASRADVGGGRVLQPNEAQGPSGGAVRCARKLTIPSSGAGNEHAGNEQYLLEGLRRLNNHLQALQV